MHNHPLLTDRQAVRSVDQIVGGYCHELEFRDVVVGDFVDAHTIPVINSRAVDLRHRTCDLGHRVE